MVEFTLGNVIPKDCFSQSGGPLTNISSEKPFTDLTVNQMS